MSYDIKIEEFPVSHGVLVTGTVYIRSDFSVESFEISGEEIFEGKSRTSVKEWSMKSEGDDLTLYLMLLEKLEDDMGFQMKCVERLEDNIAA